MRTRQGFLLVLAFFFSCLARCTSAFVAPASSSVQLAARDSRKMTTPRSMSSLPDDSSTNKQPKQPQHWRDMLPPGPEDQLTMTGDILALFVYSFLDHSMNGAYQDMVEHRVGDPSVLDPAGELVAHQVPVWFDSVNSMESSEHLLALLGMPAVSYSPILGTAGISAVLLTACWLLSGYLHQAFLFQNTLQCRTDKVLTVTLQAWITTCMLMVGLAMASHYVCPTCSLSGLTLTKADADYIFDSLTVLLMWRFIVSWMLGYSR